MNNRNDQKISEYHLVFTFFLISLMKYTVVQLGNKMEQSFPTEDLQMQFQMEQKSSRTVPFREKFSQVFLTQIKYVTKAPAIIVRR